LKKNEERSGVIKVKLCYPIMEASANEKGAILDDTCIHSSQEI
jgi:hypothetical protein